MDRGDRIMYGILILLSPAILLTFLILVVSPFWIAREYFHPSQKIELNVSEWECISTYKVQRFTGKIWYAEILCADYHRISK